jgi:hypothetical protein
VQLKKVFDMVEYFKTKVVKIEDGAVYQGISYEQYVTLELENGQKLTFFDPNFRTLKNMLEKEVKVKAIAMSINPKENLEKKQEIIQTLHAHAKISGKVIGKVKQNQKTFDSNYPEYILDAKYAKFCFHTKDPLTLKKGAYTTLGELGNRIDIKDVKLIK